MQTTPQGRSFLGDERCTAAILVFVTTTVLGMRGWRKAGLMAAENTRGDSQMEDGEGMSDEERVHESAGRAGTGKGPKAKAQSRGSGYNITIFRCTHV
jgi:hypothetical protein